MPGRPCTALCTYQCYAPLPPVRAIVGQGGDLINLHINCPNIRDIPNNQIPLQKVGDYWVFDTRSVTVQYTETVAVLKVSSEVIKCPTIGAASFGQSPYIAHYLPVRGVVGHNIDRCISLTSNTSFLQTRSNQPQHGMQKAIPLWLVGSGLDSRSQPASPNIVCILYS